MKRIFLSVCISCCFTTIFAQSSKIAETVKQINYKLKVIYASEGKVAIQVDDEGYVVLTRTIKVSENPNFHLNESFKLSDVNMVIELMSSEIPNAMKKYILYFRCKEENCVRFDNDNNLTRFQETSDLMFKTQEDAEKIKTLFNQIVKATTPK